jgi:misacylated tRNA(Ala) deacylase
MTTLPYQENSYLKEIETTVKEVNDKFIILDSSIFIPAAGGLPNDEGTINNDYKVIYAIKKDNNISLEVDKSGLKAGDKVTTKLDWERRYRIMQYHTALHALTSILHKETGALVTGNQISLDQARVDFSLENFDKEKINEAIEKTNQALKTNQEVTISYLSREEAKKRENLARLAVGLPKGIKNLRIVKIGDIDEQADGGPHVKNTSEIPNLELVKTDNKGKNNRRVYFKLK